MELKFLLSLSLTTFHSSEKFGNRTTGNESEGASILEPLDRAM